LASPQTHHAFAQQPKAFADISTGAEQTALGAFTQPDEVDADDLLGKHKEE